MFRLVLLSASTSCSLIVVSTSYAIFWTLLTLVGDLQGGQTLCLPPTCNSYIVQSGDTCISIAEKSKVKFHELISWNPSLNNYCTNLLSGRNICVSPPGGTTALTTIPGATATNTAVFATTTASPPSPIASGTTRKCGSYYLVQAGDYCQLVALNQTITLSLFLAVNSGVDAQCSNLQKGVYYCVFPTADWNTTTVSTTVTPPASVPTGTTPDCYEYYLVQSGDYCAKLQDQFVITFSQLQYWNPSLQADCSNLMLGAAYCVHGVDEPPSAVRMPEPTGDSVGVERRLERDLVENVSTMKGGVPIGWPYLYAPRYSHEL